MAVHEFLVTKIFMQLKRYLLQLKRYFFATERYLLMKLLSAYEKSNSGRNFPKILRFMKRPVIQQPGLLSVKEPSR